MKRAEPRIKRTRLLVLALMLVAALDLCGIWWGLPNRDRTWAADELGAIIPLAIAKRVATEPFNSGWFYFKYPLGHPLLLSVVYSPVLMVTWLAGGLGELTTEYPYGLHSPERVLTTLTCLGRLVGAGAGVGLALLVALITRCLFGSGGILAALLVGASYPFVFYAHTSNVDIPFIAWSMLALWSGLEARDGSRLRWYVIGGSAAGLAVASKEPAIGLVLPIIALTLLRRWHSYREAISRAGALALSGMVAWSIANAAVLNPAGAINRLLYLTGMLPADVIAKYAAYSLPVAALEGRGLAGELRQLGLAASAVCNSLGWPASLVGLGGMLWLSFRRPGAAAWLWLPGLGYYLMAVRPMNVLSLRYTMPLTLLLGITAGGALAAAGRWGRMPRALAALVLVPTLLGGLEVDRLLLGDPRYQAEAWLTQHAGPGSRVEVYQRPTYLPRFRGDLVVQRIPLERRQEGLFRMRRPDFVVLSAASHQRLDHSLNPNWRDGRPSWLPVPPAIEFFRRLRSGELGYRQVGRFISRPVFLEERITSLNPETVIFARVPEEPGR